MTPRIAEVRANFSFAIEIFPGSYFRVWRSGAQLERRLRAVDKKIFCGFSGKRFEREWNSWAAHIPQTFHVGASGSFDASSDGIPPAEQAAEKFSLDRFCHSGPARNLFRSPTPL